MASNQAPKTAALLLGNRTEGYAGSRRDEQIESTAIGIAAAMFKRRPELLSLLLGTLPCHQSCLLPIGWLDQCRHWRDLVYLCRDLSQDSVSGVTGSPLVFAVLAKNTEAFTILLDRGYEPDWRTWKAIGYWNATAMTSILRHRDLKFTVDGSRNCHLEACVTLNAAIRLHSNVELVRLLLDVGLPVNCDTRSFWVQRTPLQTAVEQGNILILRILLEAGAKVNAPPCRDKGASALQLAAIKGYLGIVKLLLEPERSVIASLPVRLSLPVLIIRNRWAKECDESKAFLVVEKANMNCPRGRSCGRTALEGAAEYGRINMIKLLLEHGANISGTGRRQFVRSIKFAERNGHFMAAGLLRRRREWMEEDERLA